MIKRILFPPIALTLITANRYKSSGDVTDIEADSITVQAAFTADSADNSGQVIDEDLIFTLFEDFLQTCDGSYVEWSKDSRTCELDQFHKYITIPVPPSYEQLSRVLFMAFSAVLARIALRNGEGNATVHSVTLAGPNGVSVECSAADAHNNAFGGMSMSGIKMTTGSGAIVDWRKVFQNPEDGWIEAPVPATEVDPYE